MPKAGGIEPGPIDRAHIAGVQAQRIRKGKIKQLKITEKPQKVDIEQLKNIGRVCDESVKKLENFLKMGSGRYKKIAKKIRNTLRKNAGKIWERSYELSLRISKLEKQDIKSEKKIEKRSKSSFIARGFKTKKGAKKGIEKERALIEQRAALKKREFKEVHRLSSKSAGELEDIVSFVLGRKDIDKTFIEERAVCKRQLKKLKKDHPLKSELEKLSDNLERLEKEHLTALREITHSNVKEEIGKAGEREKALKDTTEARRAFEKTNKDITTFNRWRGDQRTLKVGLKRILMKLKLKKPELLEKALVGRDQQIIARFTTVNNIRNLRADMNKQLKKTKKLKDPFAKKLFNLELTKRGEELNALEKEAMLEVKAFHQGKPKEQIAKGKFELHRDVVDILKEKIEKYSDGRITLGHHQMLEINAVMKAVDYMHTLLTTQLEHAAVVKGQKEIIDLLIDRTLGGDDVVQEKPGLYKVSEWLKEKTEELEREARLQEINQKFSEIEDECDRLLKTKEREILLLNEGESEKIKGRLKEIKNRTGQKRKELLKPGSDLKTFDVKTEASKLESIKNSIPDLKEFEKSIYLIKETIQTEVNMFNRVSFYFENFLKNERFLELIKEEDKETMKEYILNFGRAVTSQGKILDKFQELKGLSAKEIKSASDWEGASRKLNEASKKMADYFSSKEFKEWFAQLKEMTLNYEKALSLFKKYNLISTSFLIEKLYPKGHALEGEISKMKCKRFDSVAITYMQRGPRYGLLLRDLLKAGGRSNAIPEQLEPLEKALGEVQSKLSDIDKAMGTHRE